MRERETEATRRCRKCGQVKPMSAFHHSRRHGHGARHVDCAECVNAASRRKRAASSGRPEGTERESMGDVEFSRLLSRRMREHGIPTGDPREGIFWIDSDELLEVLG